MMGGGPGPYHNHGGGPYGMGPGGMKGNFPPMGPGGPGPYGGGGGPQGPPYGMPQYPPQHHGGGMNPNFGGGVPNANMLMASSNDSISSMSSMNSKKKRTIDGIHHNNKMPVPYPFRRVDSTTSSTSTVTVGNNTSSETHQTEESGSNKMNRTNSHDEAIGSLNMDSMMFGNNDRGRSKGAAPKPSFHRRDFSGTSTASTLSVGGFSLASYERGNGTYRYNDFI